MAFRQNRKKVRPLRPPATPTLSQTAAERFPSDTKVLTTPPGAADQAGDMMPVTPAVPGVGELVGQFQEQAETARAANEARYAQGLGIHEELVGDFGQGGTLQTAMMGQYQRQKERDLATQKQHMIGSGLMSTTIAAGMPSAYEEQVGTPYKMQMADLMAQRQAEAMRGQAGFIERREDIPPSPELMAGLVQTASARPEDVAAGEAPVADGSVSSEIATGGGVPSMSDVASQHQYTPPGSGVRTPFSAKRGGGTRTMPGFASSGSGWGSGGSSGAMEADDFADAMSSSGGGSGAAKYSTLGGTLAQHGRQLTEIRRMRESKVTVAEGEYESELKKAMDKSKNSANVLSKQNDDGGYTIIEAPASGDTRDRLEAAGYTTTK